MKRKIRLGMIGGGEGSFIGPVHRMAARMSNDYDLLAGVFSSNAERSVQFAHKMGITEDRAYPDWQTMLEKEKAREDGIEAISVVTPNDSHFPISHAFLKAGFHIICDKPLCITSANAKILWDEFQTRQQVFCVTYNYSAYPMVKQAKAMIANGEIGEIKQVHVNYVQGNLAAYHPEETKGWRHDKSKAGASLVLSDIATHAFHLAEYVAQVEVEQVFAELGKSFEERLVDDYVTCLLRFRNKAKGAMWITNAAAGAEHGLTFRIFGTKGGLEWHQEKPNELRHRKIDDFEQILTRRKDGKLLPEAEQSVFLKFGHPEGYNEAFSNLYKETAAGIRNMKEGKAAELPHGFPSVETGLRGVNFVEACIKSREENAWQNIG